VANPQGTNMRKFAEQRAEFSASKQK